jgi:hypothetical protein
MLDSYEKFFSEGYILKEQFFEFGLKETIYADEKEAENEWKNLKDRIENNQEVFIRGFGRDASKTNLYKQLYKILIKNENITKDSNNNSEPTKVITKLTQYSKQKNSKYKLISRGDEQL